MDTISAQRAMRVAKSYIDETDDINLTDKVVVRNARTTLSLAVKTAYPGVQPPINKPRSTLTAYRLIFPISKPAHCFAKPAHGKHSILPER